MGTTFGFMIFSLLFPLAGLALLVWAVLTIVRTVTLPRGGAREPACERCKYAVAGVAGFICPECGSDLRSVGIITPAIEVSRRGSLAAAILAWTFLWSLLGYFGLMATFMFIGFSAAMGGGNTITSWTHTLTPNSPLYASVELEYESDWQSLAAPMTVVLTLNDGSEHEIAVDPGPMTLAGLEAGEQPWNAALVETWFAEAGLDVGDPAVRAHAAEIGRVVDLTLMSPDSGYSMNLTQHGGNLMPTGGFAAGATGMQSNSILDSGYFWLAAAALALAVYVLGIVFMVRRRRKLLRMGAADAGATAS